MCHVTVMMNLFNFSEKNNYFEFLKYLSIVLQTQKKATQFCWLRVELLLSCMVFWACSS